MILKCVQPFVVVVVVVVGIILIQLQCTTSSSQSEEQTTKAKSKNNNETYPTLKLLVNPANGFVLNRNITITENGTRYKIPTIFDELVFECTSTLPIEWISSLSWNAKDVNKVEIYKDRFVDTMNGQSTFTSKIHFNFKSAENLMNLTCRNLCRLSRNESVNKSECHSTSFVVYDYRDDEDETYFLPYFDAYILHDHKLDNIPDRLRPGANVQPGAKCSYILNMDMVHGMYECIRKNGTRYLETGSKIIPCRNPDECNHLHVMDNCTGTFNVIKNCSNDRCLSFNIPVTPFIIVCGSGNENTIARNFFQTYRDFQNKNQRKLSMYKDRKTILDKDKDAIGGVQVLRNPHQVILPSQTCQQPDPPPMTSGNNETKTIQVCAGETVNFTCYGQLSFFTPRFRWTVTFDFDEPQDQGHGVDYTDEVKHLFYSNITIKFTANMTSVICETPRWNSLEWKNYTLTVNVTIPTTPKFDVMDQAARVEKGDNPIICKATSWPPPTYSWRYKSNNLGQKLEPGNQSSWYTIIETGSQSELYLNASSTVWNSSFDISCNASNLAHFHETHFIYRRPADKKSEWDTWGFPAIGAFSLILLILIFILVFALLKIRKQKKKLLSLSDEDLDEFKNGCLNGPEALILPYNMELEIARDNIKLGNKILGSGAFGQVTRGKVGIMTVAVKTLKKTADVIYLKALMSEIKVMAFVGRHPHIVNLIGACTENIRKHEIFIVLEYCGQGDLLTLLRRCRGIFVNYLEPKAAENERRSFVEYQNGSVKKLSTKDIMRWASEIASGMEWLSSKNVIHGDLAARNILITEDLNAKVGDFGLSKQLFEYSIYVQKLEVPLPLRWMAYESLKDLEFSIQSDIWSFGVVLWEIFTLGETPYPGIDWAFHSWELILNGERMAKPKYATDHMYHLMRETWDMDPKGRPSFQFLKESIKNHMTSFMARNTLDLTFL